MDDKSFELPSGFTAGPWRASYGGGGSFTIYGNAPSHLVICARNEMPHRAAESEANARAILSIPAMVEETGRLDRGWRNANIEALKNSLEAAGLRTLNTELLISTKQYLSRLETLCVCSESSGCKDAARRAALRELIARTEVAHEEMD